MDKKGDGKPRQSRGTVGQFFRPPAAGNPQAESGGESPSAGKSHAPGREICGTDGGKNPANHFPRHHFQMGQLQQKPELHLFQHLSAAAFRLLHRTRRCSRTGAHHRTKPRPAVLRDYGPFLPAMERSETRDKTHRPHRLIRSITNLLIKSLIF